MTRTCRSLPGLFAAAALALLSPPAATQTETRALTFPPASALEVELSPEDLERLRELVAGFVADGEVVGAELLVIKRDSTVLHEAFGWRDRAAERPMELDTLFCVRSMTKPLVGTAIQMLADERLLRLDDHVARYLPSFDNEACGKITLQQLLHHTGGFPYSMLLGQDLKSLGGIQAVAAIGGERGPEFEPGSAMQYSDQGTDTLTAVVEVVSGMPAEEFVRTRILEPLGMLDSRCLLPLDEPLRARSTSLYLGTRGDWKRFWKPEDEMLFPFFLGSQGLYSTTEDYARFLSFYLDKGRVDRERLLSSRSWRNALRPGPFPMPAGTGFPGLDTRYGSLMQLWTRAGEDGEPELVVFGHTGSDGTHAWAFPEQDAMVLYFTASRGTDTGSRVEELLGQLLLGESFDPNLVAPPLEPYLGYYWEGEGDLYRAVVRDGSGLGLDILGKTIVPLSYVGEDRWKMTPQPSTVLAFERDAEGRVIGFAIGDHREYRIGPDASLPSVDEVVEGLMATHRVQRLSEVGPLRIQGSVSMPTAGVEGSMELLLADGGRFRSELHSGENFELSGFDGRQAWAGSSMEAVAPLEGDRAERLRLDNLGAAFGDWRETYATVEVIQRMTKGDESYLVVRTTPHTVEASTRYVSEGTWRLLRSDVVTVLPGMGRMGARVTYGDYREVGGMLLPHHIETEFPTPLLGTLSLDLNEVELGVELPEGAFSPPE